MSPQETAELDLDAIEARATAATEGPWTTGADKAWSDALPPWALVISANYPLIELQEGAQGVADAEFVAAARQDVPALVAEVRRLRAQLDKPCGECHPCTSYRDETWRAAGRKPPHVSTWDETQAELKQLREVAVDLARLLHDHEGGAVPADSLQALLARATAAV